MEPESGISTPCNPSQFSWVNLSRNLMLAYQSFGIVYGGTFALYSLLCRLAKLGLLPNQQAADEELSAYRYGPSRHDSSSLPLKRFLEKRKTLQTALLIVVLSGACMVIGDSVITPAISSNLMLSYLCYQEGLT
ncbi:hypothetical protein ACSBR1_042849 [Camellia fascicularis]